MGGRPTDRTFTGSIYVRRVIDGELDVLLPELSAILLDGPKAVGKTSTAVERAAQVWRLDDAAQRAVVEADPDIVLSGNRPILVDEWQRVPPVWDAVKRAVDADKTPGRFLLTGSAASPAPTHTGAARIVSLRMRPLTLPERGVCSPTISLADLLSGDQPAVSGESELTLADYVDEIVASGFPGLRHLSGRALRVQLDNYIELIVNREMAEAGLKVRRPDTVRSWLQAYAAAVADATSYEKIRDAATSGHAHKPAKTTTLPYIDVLSDLRILDPVPAWTPSRSRLKRLTQGPKHHLADPALAARLLGLDAAALLSGAPGAVQVPREGLLLGGLFESLATLSVRVFAQVSEARVHHLRTFGGEREVDLIVERGDGRVLGVEVKLASTIDADDVKHLHWLADQLGDRMLDKVIITTGPRAYRRNDGVAVVPLALLGS